MFYTSLIDLLVNNSAAKFPNTILNSSQDIELEYGLSLEKLLGINFHLLAILLELRVF